MKIITTAAIKGGTGKTTTAAALAQAAAAANKKVLAIDTDPQANFTYSLGADQNRAGCYELLHGTDPGQLIQATEQGIDVISGSPDLATEHTSQGSAKRLRRAIEPLRALYDYIFIDTPPQIGELTLNALQASTGLIIPLEADNSSLQGLYQITDVAHQMQRSNPELVILGTILTRYDSRPKINRYLQQAIAAAGAESGSPYLLAIRPGIAIREAQGKDDLETTQETPESEAETHEKTDIKEAETKQPLQLELPFLPPLTPKYYVMPNNALMNDIERKERINYGPYDLDVFGAKSDITTYIAISYEPDPDSGIAIKGPDRLTAYERTVSNAIVSLWEAAIKEGRDKPIISPEMIYRAMPGGGDKLPKGQKGAIVKAINKFRILHIEVDATDEMQKRKVIGPKDKFTLDSNYLLTTHAEYRAQNGRTVHAYRIEAEPLILTYSKAAKQLLTIPARYLDIRQVRAGKITDKPIRMNEARQTITDYLLRRIAIMKQDAQHKTQKQSHNILFDEVYRIAGQEDKPRDQKKELRNFCFDVLEYQTAAGNISGYKKLKEGREVAKIEILL